MQVGQLHIVGVNNCPLSILYNLLIFFSFPLLRLSRTINIHFYISGYTEILSNSSEQLKRRNFRMGMLNDSRCVSLLIYIKIDVIFIYRLINDIFQHLSMNQYSIMIAIRLDNVVATFFGLNQAAITYS